jgi:predicted ATPase
MRLICAVKRPVLHATPFIGRQKELAKLKETLEEVIDKKEPRFLLIVGEAGIGKSRLLWKFQQYLVDNVSMARGVYSRIPSTGALAYGHLGELIRSMAWIAQEDTPGCRQRKTQRI